MFLWFLESADLLCRRHKGAAGFLSNIRKENRHATVQRANFNDRPTRWIIK
jgi:hypothetical protein